MGLLTILKKVKQKEQELRILILGLVITTHSLTHAHVLSHAHIRTHALNHPGILTN